MQYMASHRDIRDIEESRGGGSREEEGKGEGRREKGRGRDRLGEGNGAPIFSAKLHFRTIDHFHGGRRGGR